MTPPPDDDAYPGPSPYAAPRAPSPRRPVLAVVVVVGVLGSILFLVTRGGGSGDDEPPAAEPTVTTVCRPEARQAKPGNGRPGQITYDESPPDSGDYNPVPIQDDRFVETGDGTDSVERAVHNLARGDVVLWYAPPPAEELRTAVRRAKETVVAVPWDRGGLGGARYVLTAWGVAHRCAEVPSAAEIDAFASRYGGGGPL